MKKWQIDSQKLELWERVVGANRWSEKAQGEAVTWVSNGCREILGCGTGWKGHSATRKVQVIFHCI